MFWFVARAEGYKTAKLSKILIELYDDGFDSIRHDTQSQHLITRTELDIKELIAYTIDNLVTNFEYDDEHGIITPVLSGFVDELNKQIRNL